MTSRDTYLFPKTEPFFTERLSVGDGHSVYLEESGNPRGTPVLFLHGGPGSGASADDRRYFDPRVFRVAIFDQRGSGRSTPLGSTKSNTIDHLLNDIERIREHLGIDRWVIFGGSWGSTVALHYAVAQPTRCIALVLRGVFLMRTREIEWWLYGMRKIFPERWQRFADFAGYQGDGDLLDLYYEGMRCQDQNRSESYAREWNEYEAACSRLVPAAKHSSLGTSGLSRARLQSHYFRNGLDDERREDVLKSIREVAIPGHIIQGRYDTICPMDTAFDLHLAWPEADYRIIESAGHSPQDAAITRQLVSVMSDLGGQLSGSYR